MTKTKKKDILLTLAAFMLAAFSAALLFMIAPHRPAKADETETIDYTRFSVVERLETGNTLSGTNLNGKILVWSNTSRATISCAGNTMITIDGSGYLTGFWGMEEIGISGSSDSETIATLSEASGLSDITYFFYFSDEIEIDYLTPGTSDTVDTSDMVINDVSGTGQNHGYLLSMSEEEPPISEPEEPSNGENPGETPTNEPTETNTNEKKPFDFSEWLHNAGEDVSAWLGDNVGIATTGSTVLIVGAIIIAILLFRKRR